MSHNFKNRFNEITVDDFNAIKPKSVNYNDLNGQNVHVHLHGNIGSRTIVVPKGFKIYIPTQLGSTLGVYTNPTVDTYNERVYEYHRLQGLVEPIEKNLLKVGKVTRKTILLPDGNSSQTMKWTSKKGKLDEFNKRFKEYTQAMQTVNDYYIKYVDTAKQEKDKLGTAFKDNMDMRDYFLDWNFNIDNKNNKLVKPFTEGNLCPNVDLSIEGSPGTVKHDYFKLQVAKKNYEYDYINFDAETMRLSELLEWLCNENVKCSIILWSCMRIHNMPPLWLYGNCFKKLPYKIKVNKRERRRSSVELITKIKEGLALHESKLKDQPDIEFKGQDIYAVNETFQQIDFSIFASTFLQQFLLFKFNDVDRYIFNKLISIDNPIPNEHYKFINDHPKVEKLLKHDDFYLKTWFINFYKHLETYNKNSCTTFELWGLSFPLRGIYDYKKSYVSFGSEEIEREYDEKYYNELFIQDLMPCLVVIFMQYFKPWNKKNKKVGYFELDKIINSKNPSKEDTKIITIVKFLQRFQSAPLICNEAIRLNMISKKGKKWVINGDPELFLDSIAEKANPPVPFSG